jgi:2-amino-4-hydroxy-6-hydroxymethyldihydropteridine diphosphokinase
MHRAFLLLGSNQHSPLHQLQIARELLSKEDLLILKCSSQIETLPYGLSDQPNFWNQVLLIETNLDPFTLLDVSLSIEKKMGRIRKEKWGPRIIDLDWLFYDSLILNTNKLILPHYDAINRWFIIHLICEIEPNLVHPVLKKTIKTIYEEKNFSSDYWNNQSSKYNTS